MTENNVTSRTTFSWPVVIPSLIIISILILISAINPTLAEHYFSSAQKWVTYHFSWFYTLLVAFFLVILVSIAVSKYGPIPRLISAACAVEFQRTAVNRHPALWSPDLPPATCFGQVASDCLACFGLNFTRKYAFVFAFCAIPIELLSSLPPP